LKLIESKVGEFSIGEAFAIGLSKSLTEQLLSPYIGNGTYKSGAIKLLGAYAIPKYVLKNNVGKIVGTGLAVDGVEDIITALFKGGMGASQSSGIQTI
jgi:hypothetical protein